MLTKNLCPVRFAALAVAILATPALSQSYPNKPIHVSEAAGGHRQDDVDRLVGIGL